MKDPVEFGAMGEQKSMISVKIVIMFTVAGSGKQIDRLLQILNVLRDEEILKGLLSAQSKEEIRTAIQKREQAF